jgi:hypothetical protein
MVLARPSWPIERFSVRLSVFFRILQWSSKLCSLFPPVQLNFFMCLSVSLSGLPQFTLAILRKLCPDVLSAGGSTVPSRSSNSDAQIYLVLNFPFGARLFDSQIDLAVFPYKYRQHAQAAFTILPSVPMILRQLFG